MLLKDIPTTWMHHLNKPDNRKILEDINKAKDKRPEALVDLYKFVRDTLRPTKCWNVSGVNELMNIMTAEVKATLTGAKRGKSSASVRAGRLLWVIDEYGNNPARTSYNKERHDLQPILTDDELDQLLAAV